MLEAKPITLSPEAEPQNLSILANIKIGSFNIGSAMADILGSGVWNRIMIADLGYSATPVSLLLALNYFLAPLAIWTGQKSDHTHWRGYRRLPWVWGGRSLMAIGFLLLAFFTIELAETRGAIWWTGIVFALGMVGIGSGLSGSTFVTLIFERAPEHQRGRALGLVWTMILLGYSFAGVLFSRLLPNYSLEGVAVLFVTVVVIMSGLWFFSIFGEERPLTHNLHQSHHKVDFRSDLREVWAKPTTRLFFLYIGLSFMGAFAQEQILEPFGGQVFDLSTGETSRFAAFWGTTALLGSIFALVSYRRLKNFTYARINRYGLWTLVATFCLLMFSAYGNLENLVRPTLLLFGVGLGLWNIGTWGLMVSVSSAEKAGTYLGLWTMASLLFRGGGSVLGAIFRDVSLWITDSLIFSYGTVFAAEALILLVALLVVNQLHFDKTAEPDQERLLIAIAADA